MRHLSALETFSAHVERCPECRGSAFGLCGLGFRLLGETAGMRQDKGQMELLPADVGRRPFVRMFLHRKAA